MNTEPSPAEARSFVTSHTRLLPTPLVPEISLYIADEATALWEKTEEELGRIGLPPPFWAFAWAGGQALARFLLDAPALVAGKRVVDFASGSGIVGIAAMKAGATHVLSTDIDAFGIAAIGLNAEINGVTLEISSADIIGRSDLDAEIVLAGDVCYERPMAERVTSWLAALAAGGRIVLIGDPGRSYLPQDRLEKLADYAVPVSKTIEDSTLKQTAIWRFR